jgi:hypothetical protein
MLDSLAVGMNHLKIYGVAPRDSEGCKLQKMFIYVYSIVLVIFDFLDLEALRNLERLSRI